ncbi:MAG: lytic transglycosylase domain-containing protein [Solirubrobacterales bacterium]|nr:lytic transglycosylase domain-containing protein [Solirubrobacterales bacterium]
MARRKPTATRSKRRPAPARKTGAGRAALILFGLIAVGVIAVVVATGMAEKGIKEVTLPLRHDDVIRQQAEDKGVDAALIAAVIYTESRFVDQTSHADARGLMQITPDTAREIEKLSGGNTFELSDLRDPELNIRYGTFYLGHLIDQFGGDVVAALAAYNAGPSQAERWGGSEMRLEDIDFDETRNYVKKVLEKQREYRHRYGLELGY